MDPDLEAAMRRAREVVEAGLAERDRARIKVRQPLRSFTYAGEGLPPELADIVVDELNVKEVRPGAETVLDTKVTDDLRMEGLARDLVRQIQSERKRLDFDIADRITTYYQASGQVQAAFERFGDYIKAETLSLDLVAERPGGLEGATFRLEDSEYWIALKRLS
jgi:isoleucyl-tRNA synthetase